MAACFFNKKIFGLWTSSLGARLWQGKPRCKRASPLQEKEAIACVMPGFLLHSSIRQRIYSHFLIDALKALAVDTAWVSTVAPQL